MGKKVTTVFAGFRMPRELDRRLNAVCKQLQSQRSSVLREALEEYISSIERPKPQEGTNEKAN